MNGMSPITCVPGAPRFTAAVARVLEHEGGFVDDPVDPGGATNWGISLRYLKKAGAVDANVDGWLDDDWFSFYAGAGETLANVTDPCDGITNTTTGNIAENSGWIKVIQVRIDA